MYNYRLILIKVTMAHICYLISMKFSGWLIYFFYTYRTSVLVSNLKSVAEVSLFCTVFRLLNGILEPPILAGLYAALYLPHQALKSNLKTCCRCQLTPKSVRYSLLWHYLQGRRKRRDREGNPCPDFEKIGSKPFASKGLE